MTNWLLRVLFSMTLAFILLQGYSRESSAASQNISCFAQPATLHETAVAAKIQSSEDRQSLHRQQVSSHKKERTFRKLLATDNDDDDDDCNGLPSYKKYLTDNCFYSALSIARHLFCSNQPRLHQGQYAAVVSDDRHLLLCTLRI